MKNFNIYHIVFIPYSCYSVPLGLLSLTAQKQIIPNQFRNKKNKQLNEYKKQRNSDREQLFFITSTIKDWLEILLGEHKCRIITDSLQFCTNKYKASLIGYVIMPNHIHLILFYNESVDVSGFMRDFKKYTSFHIRRIMERWI